MRIVSGVARTLQRLLGQTAEVAARVSETIRRRRKFTGSGLVSMLVLGFLKKPRATSSDLARTAAELGIDVTPQAVSKRFTSALIACLREVFERAAAEVVLGETRTIPLLEKFTAVRVGDSSTILLPDEMAEQFPGCGGTDGSGKAALKLQVEWNQRDGGLKVILEAGRSNDSRSALMRTLPERGSLSIRDLGYFSTEWFTQRIAAGAFFLSRRHPKTLVFHRDGVRLDLLPTLESQCGGQPFDREVLVGQAERVPCRLIAFRVSPEALARRRQKAYLKARKDGRTPTDDHLEWLAWTVFVTNCDSDVLAWKEAVVLYRSRWQIELLFKLWKSHNLLSHDTGRESVVMWMAKFYARLIAVLVQHWILLTSAWSEARHSLRRAAAVLQEHIVRIIAVLRHHEALCQTLDQVRRLTDRPSRIGQRRQRPGTFQLLRDPDLLNYNI